MLPQTTQSAPATQGTVIHAFVELISITANNFLRTQTPMCDPIQVISIQIHAIQPVKWHTNLPKFY